MFTFAVPSYLQSDQGKAAMYLFEKEHALCKNQVIKYLVAWDTDWDELLNRYLYLNIRTLVAKTCLSSNSW